MLPEAVDRRRRETGRFKDDLDPPPLPALGAGRRMRLLYVGHGLQRGEAPGERGEIPAPKESMAQAGNQRLMPLSRAQR